MKLAGIDLAWHCVRNPTAIAIGDLSDRKLTVRSLEIGILAVTDIMQKLLSIHAVKGIAIDASLIITNKTGQRVCENELARQYGAMGASCHATNLTLYPDAASVELSHRLTEVGFEHLGQSRWQIECYPHPAIIEMFGLPRRLAYKKGLVDEKKAGQIQLANLIKDLANSHILALHLEPDLQKHLDSSYIDGLKGKQIKTNEDTLDAIICLYIAGLYAVDAAGAVFGNLESGYIWVPQEIVLPGS